MMAKTKTNSTSQITTTKSSTPSKRLDVAVAEIAGVSRERAQALILAGHVKVDGARQTKSGARISAKSTIQVTQESGYVSRGAYKLERALEEFAWSPAGLRCLDVGASTGGFTDCLLRHGATSVTAVDVGYGHIAWRLRQDSRVSVVERCNFRHADIAALGGPFALACVDVSFISLTKLAAQLALAVEHGGRLIALVKPQFEAGRSAVGKGGVVVDRKTQERAIVAVIDAFEREKLLASKLTYSPLKGPAGNIEFLLGAEMLGGGSVAHVTGAQVAGVVRKAHEALD